jgi:predicted N-acetyltransferase YhbS
MAPQEADQVSQVIVASIRAALPSHYSQAAVDGLVAGNSPAEVLTHGPKQTDYVYELDGRIVAMLGIKRNEVGHLFVDPAFAGKGIGRTLVDFAAGQFRKAGYTDMIVMASLNAADFYARCGFVAESSGSFPVGDNVPLAFIKMRAKL